jgi:cytochrome c553
MTSRSAWLALSLTLAMLAAGHAQAADKARGAKLAYTCHGCHGIPNYKNAFPVYSVRTPRCTRRQSRIPTRTSPTWRRSSPAPS